MPPWWHLVVPFSLEVALQDDRPTVPVLKSDLTEAVAYAQAPAARLGSSLCSLRRGD